MNPVLIVNERVPVSNIEGAGVAYEAILSPKIYTSGNPNNAYECLNDSVGWIYLSMDVLGLTAAASPSNQFVFAWSYLANDGVAVKAIVNAQIARIGAGVDGTMTRNVRSVQLEPSRFPVELSADPYNTIKTFYGAYVVALATCFISVSGTKPS